MGSLVCGNKSLNVGNIATEQMHNFVITCALIGGKGRGFFDCKKSPSIPAGVPGMVGSFQGTASGHKVGLTPSMCSKKMFEPAFRLWVQGPRGATICLLACARFGFVLGAKVAIKLSTASIFINKRTLLNQSFKTCQSVFHSKKRELGGRRLRDGCSAGEGVGVKGWRRPSNSIWHSRGLQSQEFECSGVIVVMIGQSRWKHHLSMYIKNTNILVKEGIWESGHLCRPRAPPPQKTAQISLLLVKTNWGY